MTLVEAAEAVLEAWNRYIDYDEFDPLVDAITELRQQVVDAS